MSSRRFRLWSPETLAASLRLAFLIGLIDAGNDNGRLAGNTALALRPLGRRRGGVGREQCQRINIQGLGKTLDDGERGGRLRREELPEVGMGEPAPVRDVADRDATLARHLAQPCGQHLLQAACHGESLAVADLAVLLYPEEVQ